MFDQEMWTSIDEFPQYSISSYGNVRHDERDQLRRVSVSNKGFPIILLSYPGSPSRAMRQINGLVAKAFLAPPAHRDDNSVWHIDGDLMNCHVDNLRWDMRSRVLEWNEMHRRGTPKYKTPLVKNNRTGLIYESAYHCGIASGEVESKVLWIIERQAPSETDDRARFRYIFE